MTTEFNSAEAELALITAKSINELETALATIFALRSTLNAPDNYGRRLFATALDTLLRDVARKLTLRDIPLPKGNGDTCIIATEFYPVGGHSRVARDIAELLGDRPPTIMLTDSFNYWKHRQLLPELANPGGWNRRARLVLGADRLVDKIVELYNLIAAVRPSRIFMMTHHMDVVAPVALWPFREVVEFLHHADHMPALGATLPFRHVDLTWRCHLACQARGRDPVYAGLDPALPPIESDRRSPRDPNRIRIATCGSPLKYQGRADYRWTDYAIAALADPRAEIIHVGPDGEGLKEEIEAALAKAMIDPARYRITGQVSQLSAALVEHEADVYLASYPRAGGKAVLEAMAAGFRPIQPVDPRTPDLMRFDLPGASWIEIATPAELPGAIAQALDPSHEEIAANRAALAEESERFRRYVVEPPQA